MSIPFAKPTDQIARPGRRSAPAVILFLAAVLLVPVPATAASECGWLTPAEVDQLLPQFRPWRVQVGGAVGSCQFLSRRDQAPNIFSANQMVFDTEAEATAMASNLKVESAKSSEVVERSQLGEKGFTYGSTEGDVGARTVNFVGHRGRVVVLGLVSLQIPVGEAELEAVFQLADAALSVSDQPDLLAAASECPWFENSVVAKLLPASGVRQQMFGENSCMAQDDDNAVLLVSATALSPAMMDRRGGGCTWLDQPQLGSGAVLGYSCSEGNPRATLRFSVGSSMIEYNLTPGKEPSEAQRQALGEMAAAVRQRLER